MFGIKALILQQDIWQSNDAVKWAFQIVLHYVVHIFPEASSVNEFQILFFKLLPGRFQVQMGSHPSFNFRWTYGLCDVINGAQFKSPDLIFNFSFSRQKDHRDIFCVPIGLEPSTNLVTVYAWHHDVYKDEFRSNAGCASMMAFSPLVAAISAYSSLSTSVMIRMFSGASSTISILFLGESVISIDHGAVCFAFA